MGDRDAVLHLLNFVSEKWGFECFNALGQAYPATRDQRCLTSFYIHCHGSGDIVLDHEQRIVSTMAAVPLEGYSVDPAGRLVNVATGQVTSMLHGNGWQAHLTKNEFFAKYEVVPGGKMAPRAGYSQAWFCWDPRNRLPCHGFDLVGALYAGLWVLSAGGCVLLAIVLAGGVGRLYDCIVHSFFAHP